MSEYKAIKEWEKDNEMMDNMRKIDTKIDEKIEYMKMKESQKTECGYCGVFIHSKNIQAHQTTKTCMKRKNDSAFQRYLYDKRNKLGKYAE